MSVPRPRRAADERSLHLRSFIFAIVTPELPLRDVYTRRQPIC